MRMVPGVRSDLVASIVRVLDARSHIFIVNASPFTTVRLRVSGAREKLTVISV